MDFLTRVTRPYRAGMLRALNKETDNATTYKE